LKKKPTHFDFDFVPSFGHFLSSRRLSLSGKPPQVMVRKFLSINFFNYLINFIVSILCCFHTGDYLQKEI
jgi:hypothetical protein